MLIKNLIPVKASPKENMEAFIARVERISIKQREADKLQGRIKKESQFNRKVDLNRTLNDLKEEIEDLKR